jgi:hypothetical protein
MSNIGKRWMLRSKTRRNARGDCPAGRRFAGALWFSTWHSIDASHATTRWGLISISSARAPVKAMPLR